MLTPLFSGLVGALIGGFITAIAHIWRLYREELDDRTDELCELLLQLNRDACAYWAEPFSQLKDARSREAGLIGLTSLVEGLCASLKQKLLKSDADLIEGLLSDLTDAVSGGNFSEADRSEDLNRVRQIPFVVSKLIVSLREAHSRTLPMNTLATSYRANRQRSIDLDPRFR